MLVRRLWPAQFSPTPGRLESMRREMQTLFDALEGTTASRSPGVFPAVNVTQDPDNFYLRAELPGVKTGDLDLSAVQNRVTLSGKREIPQEEGASYHRRERAGGSFGRTVTLPQEIDTKKVAARYDNGILTVTLPKVEAHKPRSIAIKTR